MRRKDPCTFVLDQATAVVASFGPVHLRVEIAGPGKVRLSPSGAPCEDSGTICTADYALGTDVVLTAVPDAPGDAIRWSDQSWCQPDGAVCRTRADFDLMYVTVGFGDFEPPPVPFQVAMAVRVSIGGDGSGTVTGPGLNCPPDCVSDAVDYAKRIVLTAHPAAGSTFARWLRVCATSEVCSF